MLSPLAIMGRKRCFCSGVPKSINVGPSRKIPFWLTRIGAPARQYSSSKIRHSIRSQARPPNSLGQVTMLQLPVASVRSHSRCCSKPSAESKLSKGRLGTCTASQLRTSWRNACCWSVYSSFIKGSPGQSALCGIKLAWRFSTKAWRVSAESAFR